MKNIKRKSLIMILCLTLCAATVSITFAYIKVTENKVENTFTLETLECTIDEDFDGKIKSDVVINNSSEIAAYIRAEIIVTWMDSDGKEVYAEKPMLNEDYLMLINDNDWFLASDGYYYHKAKVNGDDSTEVLIEEAQLAEGITPPEGYHLSIEVVSSAIQANPEHAVTEMWPAIKVLSGELTNQ